MQVVGESSEVGPRVSEGVVASREDGSAQGGEVVMSEGADTASGSKVWRADGRPVWWFEGVVEENGRVVVVAEAIARDVVSARRSALEGARAALQRACGGVVEERVEAALARQLPGDGPGRDRFVGYVRMSCRRGE